MYEIKKCSKCGVEYPKTYDYFYKSGKYMQSWCKKCWKELNDARREYKRQHYLKNKERYNEAGRQRYREVNPIETLPEGMKRCGKCGMAKPISAFGKSARLKDGLRCSCNECRRQEYLANREHNIKRSRRYYRDNKETVLQKNKEYKERRVDWYRDYNQEYYKENKEDIKKGVKERHYKRLKEDIGYRLLQRCRTRIYQALKGQIKSKRTRKLIGCSVEKLKQHLESQFQEGMSWDNYGEWHVDHIRPCAMFDFTRAEDQLECFHYTNLQPLWAEDNQRKSDKYEEALLG